MLSPGQWLNDTCISFALRRIEDAMISDSSLPHSAKQPIRFLDPSVISFVNLQADEEELDEFSSSWDLPSAQWLLAVVNDNSSFSSSSTHWSLLLCHLCSGFVMHIDSSSNYNSGAAAATSARLQRIIGRDVQLLHCAGTPQQLNCFDCGVYALLTASAFSRLSDVQRKIILEEAMAAYAATSSSGSGNGSSGSRYVSCINAPLEALNSLLAANVSCDTAAAFRKDCREDMAQISQQRSSCDRKPL